MKLIARDSMHGVKVGETFETNTAEACRLITYGFATPAHPGPGKKTGPGSRRPADDAALATALRIKVRAEELQRLQRLLGSAGPSTEPTRPTS